MQLSLVTNMIRSVCTFCTICDTVVIMLKFDKLLKVLESQGKNKFFLRQAGINPTQLNKMLSTGDCGGKTLNKLCSLLHCQPGDIMEYVPDDEA